MRLLAIDTATEALSVALDDDGRQVAHRFQVIGRGHAEATLPWIHELLHEVGWTLQSIGAIAVGRGPGAFTGVRIGVSVAQGLALGLEVPVIGISDLEAVAVAAARRAQQSGVLADTVLVALDARMGEVYAAEGRISGDAVEMCWEALCAPGDLRQRVAADARLVVAGHGFSAYPDLAAGFATALACYPDQLPDAAVIAELGRVALRAGLGVDAAALAPVYLRDEVATRSGR
jgi:tRNA threonylcarbamoyladenosine biosynthesis protein TsaB